MIHTKCLKAYMKTEEVHIIIYMKTAVSTSAVYTVHCTMYMRALIHIIKTGNKVYTISGDMIYKISGDKVYTISG